MPGLTPGRRTTSPGGLRSPLITSPRVITRAATSRRPRARYPVGVLARGLFLLRRWLPPAASDAFVRTQFPFPHPQAGPGPSRPQRART